MCIIRVQNEHHLKFVKSNIFANLKNTNLKITFGQCLQDNKEVKDTLPETLTIDIRLR